MNASLDCIPCFLRQALDAARRVTDDESVHERLVRDVLRLVAGSDLGLSPPAMGQAIHRRLRELTGTEDPYRDAKDRANRLALEALPHLAEVVRRADDPLLTATRLAVAANAIDMGTTASLGDAEVREALRGSLGEPLHGDVAAFRTAVAEAKSILYLADNAGEIAVDRLLVQELGPHRVTVVVRGAPVLNDATLADARAVGMHELAEVIDNGSDAPGTMLADCRASFRERFARAGLVVAKGQGNYETLSDVAGNLVFLFKVKCPVISSRAGLPVGAHVLLGRAMTPSEEGVP